MFNWAHASFATKWKLILQSVLRNELSESPGLQFCFGPILSHPVPECLSGIWRSGDRTVRLRRFEDRKKYPFLMIKSAWLSMILIACLDQDGRTLIRPQLPGATRIPSFAPSSTASSITLSCSTTLSTRPILRSSGWVHRRARRVSRRCWGSGIRFARRVLNEFGRGEPKVI